MLGTRIIESVARALDIMELLDLEGELGVTEIARKLNMEKSTVYRTLNTLRIRSYVSQDPQTLKYSNGYKLFEMGHNVLRNSGIPQMAQKFMKKLAEKYRRTVNLGLREGDKVVYVANIDSDDAVKVCMKTGQAIPLYCTSLGKALICFMPEHELRNLLGRGDFIPFTGKTARNLDELLPQLALARRQGYSTDDEEHILGIVCVGAPVFNAKGETIASLGLSIPKMAHNSPDYLHELGQGLCEVAAEFSKSIGGRRPAYF